MKILEERKEYTITYSRLIPIPTFFNNKQEFLFYEGHLLDHNTNVTYINREIVSNENEIQYAIEKLGKKLIRQWNRGINIRL